ncbi:unnamed protein product [Ectocarpus sp. 6 AP-2014]
MWSLCWCAAAAEFVLLRGPSTKKHTNKYVECMCASTNPHLASPMPSAVPKPQCQPCAKVPAAVVPAAVVPAVRGVPCVRRFRRVSGYPCFF